MPRTGGAFSPVKKLGPNSTPTGKSKELHIFIKGKH